MLLLCRSVLMYKWINSAKLWYKICEYIASYMFSKITSHMDGALEDTIHRPRHMRQTNI